MTIIKFCSKCNIGKPLTEFSKRSNKKTVESQCKKCAADYTLKYRINRATKLKEKQALPEYKSPATKTCSKCKTEKPIDEFNKDSSNDDGFKNYCKSCNSKIMAIYHSEHHDEESSKRAALRPPKSIQDPTKKTCTKCKIEQPIENFPTRKNRGNKPISICKTCTSKYCKNYRNDHLEKLLLYNALYHTTHKPEATKRWLIYYESHKEELLKRASEYAKTPNGKAISARCGHRRYKRMKNTKCTLTLQQWEKILKMQNNRCADCKKEFGDNLKPERDHIVPLSLGGDFTFGNVQALCKSCNSKKYNKTFIAIAIAEILITEF
jgi:5-methylcytosine-specific restriction endonuclease McrA